MEKMENKVTIEDVLKLSDFEKNRTNPFVDKAIEEINDNLVKKYRNSTGTDQKAILHAVDPNTGEMLGHTSFVRQIEVDEQQFTKIYLSAFESFFDLGTQGIRVFGYIMTKLVPKQDMFIFIIEDCLEYTKYKSKKQVYQGLSQLLKGEIIARGPSDAIYFINPIVSFNGDRVTYAKTYVKKKNNKVIENPNQISLFE
jgi:hypothetical protein